MKEAAAHIATPVLQRKPESFFQRSAEEGKEDSAFFSAVQTKLTVGQKDDPHEKQADAMADKLVHAKAPDLQKKEEPEEEEKEGKEEEPGLIEKKPRRQMKITRKRRSNGCAGNAMKATAFSGPKRVSPIPAA